MPRWKDFSFSEFRGWHPRIAVSEREGDDLRFRLFGTVFVELFAKDLTGELLINSMAPDQLPDTDRHFKRLFDEPLIGLATGFVPVQGRDFMHFEVLDLPLRDEEGGISHFLHVSGPDRNASAEI